MRLWTPAIILLSALLYTSTAAPPTHAKRLIIISWDGTPDWIVDRLMQEGKLPTLSRMARSGVHAEYVTPSVPSKTAVAHAAIWTGAYADVNGVSGNTVPMLPRSEHTLLETFDGYDSRILRAEPIWMAALRAGKKAISLAGTHQTPANVFTDVMKREKIPAERFASFDGFRTKVDEAHLVGIESFTPAGSLTREASLKVGDNAFKITIFDSPDDPVRGYDSARVCSGSDCVTLRPREAGRDLTNWSKAFRVRRGDLAGVTYFRLFSLAADGSAIMLYSTEAAALQGAASRELIERFITASGGFPDFAFTAYDRGWLGTPLYSGGDGTAEKRLVETVRFGTAILDRGTRYAIEQMNGELIINYTSALDGAGHRWMGAMDPDSGIYTPEAAAQYMPFYTEILQIQDEWLGHVLDVAGSDAVVSLVADHGMAGVGKLFYPNVVLERAGLLSRLENGIDLARTKAATPPWGEYFVAVNSTDWKNGIVKPEEKDDVLYRVSQALLNAVDPDTGAHIVTRVFRATDLTGFGAGGPASGDLFMDFAPGYLPSTAYDSANIVRRFNLSVGSGNHGFFPLRVKMQTVWFVTGPGIVAGKEVGGMRQIDIAPTLSRLLGIPAPANAKGHVIGEALAP
jgi:predicted AlkP superfamily pyrophosphatase or phosphodiesterase